MNHFLHLCTRYVAVLAGVFVGVSASAAPLLRCQVTYAGATQEIQAAPVADPYPVASVDIGGRFRFKAVMVGSAAQVDHIALYAYLQTRRQPLLLQQAIYQPPFAATVQPYALTGEQHL
jgi:hypothetical protein